MREEPYKEIPWDTFLEIVKDAKSNNFDVELEHMQYYSIASVTSTKVQLAGEHIWYFVFKMDNPTVKLYSGCAIELKIKYKSIKAKPVPIDIHFMKRSYLDLYRYYPSTF